MNLNKNIKNLYNITSIGQVQNNIHHIYGGNITYKTHLYINIIFIIIGILIAISCNKDWTNRIIGIILSLVFGPLYSIYKFLNPSITFEPNLCFNIDFKDRIISAFQK